MKRGCVIAIALAGGALAMLVAGIVAIVLVVFSATGPAVDAADKFLTVAGSGDSHAAYEMTADTLRSGQSEEQFREELARLGLTGYKSATWTSRSIKNNLATLEGTIHTANGGSTQLTMQLVPEGEQWKVLSVSGPATGVQAEPAKQIPSDDKLRQLAARSVLDLQAAVREGSFDAFHKSISAMWKSQVTPEELAGIFKPLAAADLPSVESIEPVFAEPPAINSDGLLVLTGYFPTQPLRIDFELKYLYEHPDWKLFGIHVRQMTAPAESTSPEDQK